MFIPGMSAAMVGVGVGVPPDMSIPGISAAMVGVGVGVPPDMSIPGMFIPAIPPALLLDGEPPATSNDVDLDANTITATKMATATATEEIRMRLDPVVLVIEKSSQDRRVALGHHKDLRTQASVNTVGCAPRDSPGVCMKVP